MRLYKKLISGFTAVFLLMFLSNAPVGFEWEYYPTTEEAVLVCEDESLPPNAIHPFYILIEKVTRD